MIDYCLKNADKAEFNQLMLDTGLCLESDDGVHPADYTILIDRIGPITIGETVYPEYYSNVRILGEVTEEQAEALLPYAIDPSTPQYRTWA
jgi:hypothetical protein